MAKHPAADAWDNWIVSEAGKEAATPGHIEHQYLENRLHRAFMAGFNKGADAMKQRVLNVYDKQIEDIKKKLTL